MRRWRFFEWLALGSTLVVGGAVGWQLSAGQLSRGVAAWGIVITVIVAVAVGLATWRLQPGEPGIVRRRLSWHSVARLVVATIAALSAGFFADSFFAPRQAVESGPGAIEDGVERANQKLDELSRRTFPRGWRAFDNIEGYWGEAHGGCQVIYHFERLHDADDHSLAITLVRGAPGMGNYEMIADIIEPGEGDVLRAEILSSTSSDEARGEVLTFLYSANGSARRLTWRNGTNDVDTPLDRCEAP